LREARIIAIVAAGLLGISLLAGLVHLIWGRKRSAVQRQQQEGGSWALLVSVVLLITSVVVLAVANLRRPEINLLAIVGLREPELEEPEEPATKRDEAKEKTAKVDWQEQLLPKGAETRIGDNLKYLIDKERGGPIAGIILFSDGGSNAGLSYEVAAGDAASALIPVYSVGLGSDKRPVNVRMVDLEAPERVYPGDKFTLTGYVQAINSSRASLTVELLSSDKDGKGEVKEDEQTLNVGSTGKVVPIKFEHTPKDQGIRIFRLRVQTVEGELDKKDNEKTAKVEIVDRKTKVLLIASGPAREFIFLRNQLFRDKETTVDVLLQSGRPGISQEAHDILNKFPESADELFQYDCIVGFDPDWEALDDLQVKNLDRWVAEKAGGLIVVAGPVCTPGWTARRRGDPRIDTIKALYPVIFYNQSSATLSLGRFGGDKPWPLTFTRDGMEAEFLWIDEDAEKSQSARDEFAGVYGYYAVKDPKPGARIYSRFSDPDTAIDSDLPIYMAGHFYGSGRVFFQASGEMWRIRELDEKFFETYYTKLIRWASEGRLLRDSSRGVLLVDKDRCLIGDQVAVRAILQDVQFQPLALPEVEAVLIQPDQKRTPLVLKRVKDAAREGMYAEQFTVTQEGDYRIELQHPDAAEQLMVREVRARMPARETENPQRNDQLLKTLADRTSGIYYVGMDPAVGRGSGQPGIASQLKAQDQVTPLPGTPDRRFEQLLMTWLMGLICGVLCLEWLLRRLSKLA
ncbi:MAG: VWA domain-containing protein, partial [Pirellulaceae bacterium]|nr:VWA domain-containing protein [Pirellulaceae bacterium]